VNKLYIENYNMLIALITHLGATDKASRTPTSIANDLRFEKDKLLFTLDNFPAYFRKSKKTSDKDKSQGDHFFTLHLRYSRRKLDKSAEGESQPLSTEEINMLLGLVTHMLEQEQENSRVYKNLEQSYRNLENTNKITMFAAIGAAVIAGISAVVAAVL
jgi:hypothetical protein